MTNPSLNKSSVADYGSRKYASFYCIRGEWYYMSRSSDRDVVAEDLELMRNNRPDVEACAIEEVVTAQVAVEYI